MQTNIVIAKTYKEKKKKEMESFINTKKEIFFVYIKLYFCENHSLLFSFWLYIKTSVLNPFSPEPTGPCPLKEQQVFELMFLNEHLHLQLPPELLINSFKRIPISSFSKRRHCRSMRSAPWITHGLAEKQPSPALGRGIILTGCHKEHYSD